MPQPAPSIPVIEPLYRTFFALKKPPTPPEELYPDPTLSLQSFSIRTSDGTTHHFQGVRLGRGLIPIHPSFHAEWPQLPTLRRKLLLILVCSSIEKATMVTSTNIEGVWVEVPPQTPQ